ncbi:MAG: type I antifreeze protein [Prochlorococcus sp.]
MAYNEAQVVMGGLVHIPLAIGVFWSLNNLTSRNYHSEQAALAAEAEAKKAAEAAAAKAAEEAAKAKAAAAKAAEEAAKTEANKATDAPPEAPPAPEQGG